MSIISKNRKRRKRKKVRNKKVNRVALSIEGEIHRFREQVEFRLPEFEFMRSMSFPKVPFY